MGAKEVVISEILRDAQDRVTRARVGEPGQPAPIITPEQQKTLERAQSFLKIIAERTLWQLWNRANPRPETRESRIIGGDKWHATIS